MRYSTAKKFILDYRKNHQHRAGGVDHRSLRAELNRFEQGLARNRMLSVY